MKKVFLSLLAFALIASCNPPVDNTSTTEPTDSVVVVDSSVVDTITPAPVDTVAPVDSAQ